MNTATTLTSLCAALLLATDPAVAQTAPNTGASRSDTSLFAPLTLPPAPSDTRLANGAPGPKYWQNRADYDLKGTLDTATHSIRGSMTLRYTNNSPDTLPIVWFQTEQSTEVIDRFDQLVSGKSVPLAKEHADGDILETKVTLAEPLKPGQTATFNVEWHFIVHDGGLRMGRDGTLYELGQWYPRPNVYDDVKGWNTESYVTDAEFYLDYGDYNLEVTVPAGYIVAATGTLDNPKDVLTATEIARLDQAAKSDTVVRIITAAELSSGVARPIKVGTLTWKFHAKNVRDAAWAAAPDYQWDATHWNDILTQSYYRPKAAASWVDAADQTRMSVQEYSERWYPYPYPQASAVEGPVPGMEYPMLAMEDNGGTQDGLYKVLTHEVGHNWFPMIVGSNERLHAWMDEGFNTFINSFSEERRYPSNSGQENRLITGVAMSSAMGSPIMDHILESGRPTRNDDAAQYFKTGYVLQLLRYVLGPDVFDKAFRSYIQRWAFKHPTPMDFFRTMEDVSGRKLAWFWREFFLEAPHLDQDIRSVKQTARGGETHVTVTYGNRERMVLPLLVRFTFSDGTTENISYPGDVWENHPAKYTVSYTFHNKTVRSIALDPDNHYLLLWSSNSSNRTWTAK